ncbi:hypothetical protein ZWY2020_051489 [Hordeum vulgare]|nr:hypothetical protein ZWY2020_051489 [Hordeum vulgare]
MPATGLPTTSTGLSATARLPPPRRRPSPARPPGRPRRASPWPIASPREAPTPPLPHDPPPLLSPPLPIPIWIGARPPPSPPHDVPLTLAVIGALPHRSRLAAPLHSLQPDPVVLTGDSPPRPEPTAPNTSPVRPWPTSSVLSLSPRLALAPSHQYVPGSARRSRSPCPQASGHEQLHPALPRARLLWEPTSAILPASRKEVRIHMAARVGDAAALRRALDEAALVVAAGEVGEGLEAVRCAVAAEANEAGETPLLAAVEKGRLEVVVELLRHLDAQGVAAEANEAGKTPLLAAAEKGYLEVVVELLRHLDAQSVAAEANKAGEHAAALQRYRQNAEFFVCSCVGKGAVNVPRTPGGIMYHQRWNNLQFVTSASFLLTAYADYATVAGGGAVRCPGGAARPYEILAFVRSQVNYILGDNPRATSYMVGYGLNYPRQVHHRGASIVSVRTDPSFVSCQEGYASWYSKQAVNPNTLDGAVVGGPDEYADFADERNNYEQTEAATYNSAPLLGVLARLAGACGGLDEYRPSLPAEAAVNRTARLAAARRWHPHLEVEQNVTGTWAVRRRTYHRYSVTVTNRSRKTVRGLQLGVSELAGRLWGLDKARYGYVPRRWLRALRPGRSVRFGYVQPGPPANVWVTGYKLV